MRSSLAPCLPGSLQSDLCLSCPIAYDITSMKEVIDDLGQGGRRDRNSRTALMNISYRFFIRKYK